MSFLWFIFRAPIIVTGHAQDVDLDASNSIDPDQALDTTLYTWACQKMVTADDGVSYIKMTSHYSYSSVSNRCEGC